MNCTEANDLLQRGLDGELLGDRAALDRHLAGCGDCRSLHAVATRLEEGLRLMPAPVVPAGLTNRIVAGALQDRLRRTRRRMMAMTALAASLLVAMLLVTVAGKGGFGDVLAALGLRKPEPRKGIAPPDTPAIPPSSVAPPAVASLRTSVAEAGAAVFALTRRTADSTVNQTRFLTEVLPTPMIVFESVPPMPEQPIASAWQGTSQRVAAGFEPVTSSARRALSMLLRETPTN